MTDLPSGWAVAEIGDLLHGIAAGKNLKCEERPPQAHERGVIKVSAVTWGTFDASQSKTFPRSFEPAPDTAIKAGDFLFSRANTLELVGAVVMVKKDYPNLFLSDKVLRLDLPIELKPWLLVYLRSFEGRRKLGAASSGNQMSMRNIGQGSLKSVSIPLPPLNEQRRIVEKIEAKFDEIDKGVESLQTARATLGLYRQSLLKSAFEGRLTADWRAQNADKLETPETLLARIKAERDTRYKAALDAWQAALAEWRAGGEKGKKPAKPKRPETIELSDAKREQIHHASEWAVDALGNQVDFLTSGSRGWAKFYASSGAIFIRAQNLKHDRLDLSDIAYVKLPAGSSEGMRTRVQRGDVLITITGANVTKTAVVLESFEAAYVSQHVALCRLSPSILPRFAWQFLISETCGRKQLESAAYGAGKPGLNLPNILEVAIPICSLAEQAEIVRRLDARLEAADALEAEIDAALTRARALRQSILKKAFSGHLVPQDPADEPAATLLARIKAERAKTPKAAGRRRVLA